MRITRRIVAVVMAGVLMVALPGCARFKKGEITGKTTKVSNLGLGMYGRLFILYDNGKPGHQDVKFGPYHLCDKKDRYPDCIWGYGQPEDKK